MAEHNCLSDCALATWRVKDSLGTCVHLPWFECHWMTVRDRSEGITGVIMISSSSSADDNQGVGVRLICAWRRVLASREKVESAGKGAV